MIGFDRRNVRGCWQQIVHERCVQQLTLLVVDQLLEERVADAVSDAAVDLSFNQQWIDDRSAVVDDDVLEESDHCGFDIDFDNDRVHAAGRAAAVGAEVRRRLEAGLSAGANGPAKRIGLAGEFCQSQTAPGSPANTHAPVGKLEIVNG